MKNKTIIGATAVGLIATNIVIKGIMHGHHLSVINKVEYAIAHGAHYGAGKKVASALFTPFWALRS